MSSYCNIKILLTDQRFCQSTALTYDVNFLLKNQIIIHKVPPSCTFLDLKGTFSADLEILLIIIKFGSEKFEIFGLCEDHDGIVNLFNQRKKSSWDTITIMLFFQRYLNTMIYS